MTLDFEGKEPLYRQLAAELRRMIDSGEIPPGRRLPSKKAIVQQYGVSQNTAERALAILKDEGLIETSMGRGLFVVPPEDRPRA
jgi:DNA-binding GntR family transcriptional regulator